MCLRGLGARTKDGAVLITASTCGGAIIPVIMKPVTDGRGVRYGFCVIVASFAFGSILPLYTAIFPAVKDQVDPVPDVSDHSERALTPTRASRIFNAMVRRRTGSPNLGRTERDDGPHEGWPG